MMWWLVAVALGSELTVVRSGETLEDVAARLGNPELVGELRKLNELKPREKLVPGSLLEVPAGASGKAGSALVLTVNGEATVEVPGAAPVPAEPCMPLPEGSHVCTLDDGYVTVQMRADGTAGQDDITLLPQTCLTVRSTVVRKARSSVVKVDSGAINVGTDAEGAGAVLVETPDGVLAGDGGGFRVTIEDDATRTEALYNPVAVFGAGEQVDLLVGKGNRVTRGMAPGSPVDLRPHGALRTPGDGAPLRRPLFEWETVPDAYGYRVEMATDPFFAELVLVQDVPESEMLPPMLLLPTRVPGIWWRVATFDRTGYLGIPSDAWSVRFPNGVAR